MLGGQITNQEEDEVEDELDALEAEMKGVPLPEVPTAALPSQIEDRATQLKERAKARQREREEREETRVAMLA